MANIKGIVTELETLKFRTQETIDAAHAGVNNLNEDQTEQIDEMLDGLIETAVEARKAALKHLYDGSGTGRYKNEQAEQSWNTNGDGTQMPSGPGSQIPE